MSMFRRRRRDSDDDMADVSEVADEGVVGESDGDDSDDPDGYDDARREPAARPVTAGPWDAADVDPAEGGRIDLGGLWLPGADGLEVRVEADQTTGQVVAVTLVLGDGALQLQPYAAPKTEGIWDEVRAEIRAGITQQGGTADEVTGPVGIELRTKVPVRAQDGTSGVQPARFIGVDGPRWFLRGVLTGQPAVEPSSDAALMALFRDVVVVRGADPMAPREAIPLVLPDDGGEAPAPEEADDPLSPFRRGPEITEIH